MESYYDKYHQYIAANTLKSSGTRIVPEECTDVIERVLKKPPVIHDPGNGPRVRDVKGFLQSEFFAQPPAFDVSNYSSAQPMLSMKPYPMLI